MVDKQARYCDIGLAAVTALSLSLGIASCASAPLESAPPPPPKPPEWTAVPHPNGLDLGDIEAIFSSSSAAAAKAPTRQEVADCDRPFRSLKDKTISREELALGMRELVRTEPASQHSCFYGKLLELEQKLKQPSLVIRERQDLVLRYFEHLAPLSKAFHIELNDSRYWRMAIHRYRIMSERVFFQRVEPSPETTSVLVTATNPFSWVRPSADTDVAVLKKYGISLPSGVAAPVTPPVPVVPDSAASGVTGGTAGVNEVIPAPVIPDSTLVPEPGELQPASDIDAPPADDPSFKQVE